MRPGGSGTLVQGRRGFLTCAIVCVLALAAFLSPHVSEAIADESLGSITEVTRWHSAAENPPGWNDLQINETAGGGELLVSEFGGLELYDLNGTFLTDVDTWETPYDEYKAALVSGNVLFLSRVHAGALDGWVRVVPVDGGEATHFQPTESFSPRGMAMAPDGTLWVADYVGNDIATRKADGSTGPFVGSGGAGPGQMQYPTDVAYGNNSMYVVDSGHARIERFALDGSYLAGWGSQGTGAGQLFAPTDLVVGPDGTVYVLSAPAYGQQASVDAFKADGTFVAKVALPITEAIGLTGDSAGNLYAGGDLDFPEGKKKGVLKFRVNPQPKGKAKAEKIVKVKGGKALLALSCPGRAQCVGTARLYLPATGKGGSKAGAKRKPVVLGTATIKVAPGKRKTVKVSLGKKGKRLLGTKVRRPIQARLDGTGVVARAVALTKLARR